MTGPLWVHCDVHPAQPARDHPRCRDVAAMNRQQVIAAYGNRPLTEAEVMALLKPAGPFSQAELVVTLNGWPS